MRRWKLEAFAPGRLVQQQRRRFEALAVLLGQVAGALQVAEHARERPVTLVDLALLVFQPRRKRPRMDVFVGHQAADEDLSLGAAVVAERETASEVVEDGDIGDRARSQRAQLRLLAEHPRGGVLINTITRTGTNSLRGGLQLSGLVREFDNVSSEMARQLLEQTARAADPPRLIDVARLVTPPGGGKTSGVEREQLAACLRALASLLRDIGMVSAQGDAAVLANADLAPQLRTLARTFDSDRTVRAYASVNEALDALAGNASPKVVADWLVLQL